jgi:hypothetical protein
MLEEGVIVERVSYAMAKESIWIRRTESFASRERSTPKAFSRGVRARIASN